MPLSKPELEPMACSYLQPVLQSPAMRSKFARLLRLDLFKICYVSAFCMTTFGLIAQHPAFAETKLSQTKPASQVCLSTGAGPSLCSASGGIGDAPDIPTLSVLAGETVTITFSLEAAPTADATFNVTTANGTAVATTDYTSYSGSVLCPANRPRAPPHRPRRSHSLRTWLVKATRRR